MKIKTKKRMTPEEYAKYMIDKHGISGLENELIGDNIIDAPKKYALTFELNPVSMEEMSDTGFENREFTIEVEEEVNGETILDRLYEVSFNGLAHDTNIYTNTTPNSLITSTTALIYTVIDNQVIVLWEKYTGGFR